MLKTLPALIVCFVVLLGFPCPALNAGENTPQFHSLHDVMERLGDDLRAIFDGFITGDTETIQRSANDLADRATQAMQDVAQTSPAQHGQEAVVWKAMAEIVNESHFLRETVKAGHYNEAYEHFSNVASQCIQCHQVTRDWDKLSNQPTKAEGTT